VKLTAYDKKLIQTLTTNGKSVTEVAELTGIQYINVYNYVHKDERAITRKVYREKKKTSKTIKQAPVKDTYVDTGRPLPPVYKSELKIIANKDLAELACSQLGLKPPVTTLANRPKNYSASGWVLVDGKWVAGLTIHNDGMLVRQPAFDASQR